MSLSSILSSIPYRLLYLTPPSLLAQWVIYKTTHHFYSSRRQKAYILSAISSGIMSLSSLPYFWQWYQEGVVGIVGPALDPVHEYWAKWVGAFFFSYLGADLLIGAIYYPEQVGLLTGWVHHTVYMGIMLYVQYQPFMSLILTACIMEIPTFHLAISTLHPQIRSDFIFLSIFFLTRILFHGYFILVFLLPPSLAKWTTPYLHMTTHPTYLTGGEGLLNPVLPKDKYMTPISGLQLAGSAVPGILLSMAILMHVTWFMGGVKGYFKRLKIRIAKAKAAREMRLSGKGSTKSPTPTKTPLSPGDQFLKTMFNPSPVDPTFALMSATHSPGLLPFRTPGLADGQNGFSFGSLGGGGNTGIGEAASLSSLGEVGLEMLDSPPSSASASASMPGEEEGVVIPKANGVEVEGLTRRANGVANGAVKGQ